MDRRSPQIVIDQQGPFSGAGKPPGQLDGQRGLALALRCAGNHHHADVVGVFARKTLAAMESTAWSKDLCHLR